MSTNALFDKLELAAGTPSKAGKQAIVQALTEFELDIVKRTLDPTITYGVASLDKTSAEGTDEWSPAEFQLLDDLASRRLTGNDALQQISFSMRELSAKSAELLRRVLLKDLRAGVGATLVNTSFPGAIPTFSYMRCSLPAKSNIEKWDWSEGVYSQLKADGMFANVTLNDGTLQIASRQGEAFPKGALGELEHVMLVELSDSTQTHGELTVLKDGRVLPREIGNGMLNSLRQGGKLAEGCDVQFDAWDQIPLREARAKGRYEVAYAQRVGNLNKQLDAGGASRLLRVIETKLVFSRDEANAHYREVLARGLEGTVLKYAGAIWRDGDNKDQVKLKLEVDVDLKIVGFNPGEVGKRTEHTFGSLRCQTLDGLLEVGVSGFRREVEDDLWARRDEVMGGVVCVKANGIMSPSGEQKIHSLFLPRFVELRSDKYEADTLQQVQDQFEAATK